MTKRKNEGGGRKKENEKSKQKFIYITYSFTREGNGTKINGEKYGGVSLGLFYSALYVVKSYFK